MSKKNSNDTIWWQHYSTHLHTQTIHRTTLKFWKSAGRAPSLRVLPWHLPYNRGKSTENLSQGSRRVPAGTVKIHKHRIRTQGRKEGRITLEIISSLPENEGSRFLQRKRPMNL